MITCRRCSIVVVAPLALAALRQPLEGRTPLYDLAARDDLFL